MAKGEQISVPGMEADKELHLQFLSGRVDAAVLEVSEREAELRIARARERQARKALAEARR